VLLLLLLLEDVLHAHHLLSMEKLAGHSSSPRLLGFGRFRVLVVVVIIDHDLGDYGRETPSKSRRRIHLCPTKE
jgi:hypothetical protein